MPLNVPGLLLPLQMAFNHALVREKAVDERPLPFVDVGVQLSIWVVDILFYLSIPLQIRTL